MISNSLSSNKRPIPVQKINILKFRNPEVSNPLPNGLILESSLHGRPVKFIRNTTANEDSNERKASSLIKLKLKNLKDPISPSKPLNVNSQFPNIINANNTKQLSIGPEYSSNFLLMKHSTPNFNNETKSFSKKEDREIIQAYPKNQGEEVAKDIIPLDPSIRTNVKKSLVLETKTAVLNSRNESKISKNQLTNIAGGELEENEKVKIRNYFRTRIASFVKIVSEKIKKNMSLYQSPKILKAKSTSSKEMASQNQGISNSPGINNAIPINNFDPHIEDQIKDDIWKALKRIVSTRSKYKYRDVANFDKKLQNTIKTLTYSKSPISLRGSSRVILSDEEDAEPKKKQQNKKSSANQSDYPFSSRSKSIKKFDSNTKIFMIIGGYDDLKKALENRGWVENPDTTSKVFHLKWTLKKVDLNFLELMPHQLVNHFEKNTSITTKVGLARNIRNLIWFDDTDIDFFYPRCYDLNDMSDFDDFIEDFKYTGAQAILKSLNGNTLLTGVNLDLFKLKVAVSIDICERLSKNPEALISTMFDQEPVAITQNEWDIITAPSFVSIINNSRKYEADIRKLVIKHSIKIGTVSQPSNEFEQHLREKSEAVIKEIEKTHPQHSLNGEGNIWIIKPAGLSRGRGICCYNNLIEILDHIKIKESEWVAQKYIENPLIILNKKFDIRQWVLVTDWNPLTIWFYEECYIRFSADNYDPNNLGNRFAHLTNNSIAKHSQKFEESDIDGNMWTCMEFAEHLKRLTNRDQFYEKIQPKMKQTAIKSLQCVKDMVENRKNSFELYGYDFMIDDKYQPWLIEINSSPAMDYSTAITERLVKMVLEDCVKVILDYGMNKNKNKRQINTGSFKCIYEGEIQYT